MQHLLIEDLNTFVENNIGSFHGKRLERLKQLRLNDVIHRKNPYLFKAKNILTAQDFVKSILDAHLSSQEETIFGEFLECLAIFVCNKVHGGKKSSAEGVDLEFEKDDTRYLVSIKSGPNWGNSGQIQRMLDNFKKAKRILSTNDPKTRKVVFVNTCCYGRDNNPDKGEYLKLCGQRFWHFISDDEYLYKDVIEPLGYKAKEKNELFFQSYAQILNRFTSEFINDFCSDGIIDWKRIVEFNSSKNPPSIQKKNKKS